MNGPSTRYTYVMKSDYDPRKLPYTPKSPKGLSFSHREIREILIALVVLTAAFTIILSHNNSLSIALPTATGAVIFGFFLHEMGHKFTAQKYGCWAEFRTWNMGLLMAIVTSMAGILFAAPGAVYISGRVDRVKNGKISLAGPGTNLVAGTLFLVASFATSSATLVYIFINIAFLNGFLGLFNMIPVPPLDGSKIISWNRGIYAASAAALALLMAIVYLQSPL